jgi:hypothetical protein
VSVSHTPRAGFHLPISRCTEQSSHVLDDDERRAEHVDSSRVLGPQTRAGTVLQPSTQASEGHVLAGESTGEHVDLFDVPPVDGSDIAVVRHVGPVVRKDRRWGFVELDMPRDGTTEHLLYAEVQTAIAAEQ